MDVYYLLGKKTDKSEIPLTHLSRWPPAAPCLFVRNRSAILRFGFIIVVLSGV